MSRKGGFAALMIEGSDDEDNAPKSALSILRSIAPNASIHIAEKAPVTPPAVVITNPLEEYPMLAVLAPLEFEWVFWLSEKSAKSAEVLRISSVQDLILFAGYLQSTSRPKDNTDVQIFRSRQGTKSCIDCTIHKRCDECKLPETRAGIDFAPTYEDCPGARMMTTVGGDYEVSKRIFCDLFVSIIAGNMENVAGFVFGIRRNFIRISVWIHDKTADCDELAAEFSSHVIEHQPGVKFKLEVQDHGVDFNDYRHTYSY